MAKQVLNVGAEANDATGDPLRNAMIKTNDNFTELYEGGNVDKRKYTVGIANPPHEEGLVFYDNTKKALSYYNDESETTVNLGKELIRKVYNNNGSTLTNGTAVRLDGGVNAGIPTVLRAQATTVNNSAVFGVCTHDIPTNQTGYVTIWGELGSYNTSGFTAGQ